ncbi:MAG: hypothetical protein L0Y71_25430 [Gemmataceae bacterium]|nr:hypothetical protein [Gemmataceae bacterium]
MNRLLHFRTLRAACGLLLVAAGVLMIYLRAGAQLPPMFPNVALRRPAATTLRLQEL